MSSKYDYDMITTMRTKKLVLIMMMMMIMINNNNGITIWNVRLEEIIKFVPTSILRSSPRKVKG
jgi:hypothetical protein